MTNAMAQAIETLAQAGYDVGSDGLVTSRERGKWGTVQLEEATLGDQERVHLNKVSGKPSGRFMTQLRETLGALYA